MSPRHERKRGGRTSRAINVFPVIYIRNYTIAPVTISFNTNLLHLPSPSPINKTLCVVDRDETATWTHYSFGYRDKSTRVVATPLPSEINARSQFDRRNSPSRFPPRIMPGEWEKSRGDGDVIRGRKAAELLTREYWNAETDFSSGRPLGRFKDRVLPFVTVYPTFYEEFNMSVRGIPPEMG